MNKLTVTVTRQSKPEAKFIAPLPPLLQQCHFVRDDLWQKVLTENSQSLPPFIEAELEIVFPGPYKVPTPISSCIFEG